MGGLEVFLKAGGEREAGGILSVISYLGRSSVVSLGDRSHQSKFVKYILEPAGIKIVGAPKYIKILNPSPRK